MNSFYKSLCFFFLIFSANAQSTIDEALDWYNSESVPYIFVSELQNLSSQIVLDAREWEEYEISHIENAIWVGYDDFKLSDVVAKYPEKNSKLVIYCSIGVRSENIGEKLIEAGYFNTQNLYGGIFEWTNQGYPVYNPKGEKTKKVHAYGKLWGKYLTKAEKVY